MSRSGLPCYRNGGCGPYEMLSCTECPASKSDYLQCELKPKPQTNYDRIISKTPEELAEWFWWMLKYVQGFTDSRVALLDWLKQEADEK